jgi:hypothetical protein
MPISGSAILVYTSYGVFCDIIRRVGVNSHLGKDFAIFADNESQVTLPSRGEGTLDYMSDPR